MNTTMVYNRSVIFLGELEAAVSVLDTKYTWREFFDRAKISTSKRDGCKVPAQDFCQNNSPPEYKAKTCQPMTWGFLNGHAARGV